MPARAKQESARRPPTCARAGENTARAIKICSRPGKGSARPPKVGARAARGSIRALPLAGNLRPMAGRRPHMSARRPQMSERPAHVAGRRAQMCARAAHMSGRRAQMRERRAHNHERGPLVCKRRLSARPRGSKVRQGWIKSSLSSARGSQEEQCLQRTMLVPQARKVSRVLTSRSVLAKHAMWWSPPSLAGWIESARTEARWGLGHRAPPYRRRSRNGECILLAESAPRALRHRRFE